MHHGLNIVSEQVEIKNYCVKYKNRLSVSPNNLNTYFMENESRLGLMRWTHCTNLIICINKRTFNGQFLNLVQLYLYFLFVRRL